MSEKIAYMNAEMAREKALEVNEELNDENLAAVMSFIGDAVSNGEFSVRFYESIRDDVKKILEDKGFKLNSVQSGINEYDWVIKW